MVLFRHFVLCLFWFIYFLTERAAAFSYENLTQLKTTLLTGYDPDVIPLNNQTHSFNLTMGMSLFQILDVDTVRGILSTSMSLECFWFDERMQWKPADHGGITSLKILSANVWTPPLTPGQPAEFSSFGETWMHVTYQYNGFAFWRPSGVNKVTCPMNMKYWPFDEQTCIMTFFPYDDWSGQIRFNMAEFVTKNLNENGEWALGKTAATTRHIYQVREAMFQLTIQRRPVFYILTLVLPLCGLGLMTSFVFLLPSESGERVSYAITTLLALTVFLTILSNNIPKTSNPVPLMCVFIFSGVFISSLAAFIVIINLSIYHRSSDEKVGSWYVKLVRVTSCKANKVDDETKVVEAFQHTDAPDRDKEDKSERRVETTRKISSTITDIMTVTNGSYLREQANNDQDVTWKDVSRVIDTIMFASLTTFNVLTLVIWGTLLAIK